MDFWSSVFSPEIFPGMMPTGLEGGMPGGAMGYAPTGAEAGGLPIDYGYGKGDRMDLPAPMPPPLPGGPPTTSVPPVNVDPTTGMPVAPGVATGPMPPTPPIGTIPVPTTSFPAPVPGGTPAPGSPEPVPTPPAPRPVAGAPTSLGAALEPGQPTDIRSTAQKEGEAGTKAAGAFNADKFVKALQQVKMPNPNDVALKPTTPAAPFQPGMRGLQPGASQALAQQRLAQLLQAPALKPTLGAVLGGRYLNA
jgi:hypothetical protein